MRAIELGLTESTSNRLMEDESSNQRLAALDILAELGLDGKVEMSLADMFDMTGQPYPEGVNPDFFEPRRRTVGYEPGNLAPAMANLFKEWDASGRKGTITPPTLEDWAKENGATLTYGTDIFGNPMSYNNNPMVTDMLYKMAGETWEFLGSGVVAGTAEANDWIARRMGLLNDGEKGLRDMVDPFVQFSQKVADANYNLMDQQARDRLKSAEEGITSIDDIWSAITGERGITGEGLALMVAGELPSEMASIIAFGYGKIGVAMAGGLNLTEAMGHAGTSMDERIKQMWDEGVFLTEGSVLAVAQEVFPGDEAAQLRFLQDRAKNSTLMAIGAVAGIGDTIGDAMAWTGLGKNQVQSWGRRLILGAMVEGGQEGTEQFLENLGIEKGTGADVDLFDGVTNAVYQGVVVQGGVQALGTGANMAESGIDAVRTQLRSSKDPVALLLQARNANLDGVLADIRTQFGPDATIASVFDNIPQQNELTMGQRRQLSRTGAIEVNGRRVTRAQIETASDPANRQALAILQFGTPDADNNVSLNFEKIDNLELAAKTFGIDVTEFDLTSQEDANKLATEVSDRVNMEVDVTGAIAGLETQDVPLWSSLSETQKMQLLNRGWTETDTNQQFELEDVARTSIESGDDSLPDAKYFNDLRTEILGPQVDNVSPDAPSGDTSSDTSGQTSGNTDSEVDTSTASTLDINVSPEVKITAETVAQESPVLAQTAVTVPETPSEKVRRGTIVYNATLRIANGNMDPAVIESMLDSLEKDNPGISDEILKGRDINDLANLGGGDPEIMSEIIPERPEINFTDRQIIAPVTNLDSAGRPRPPKGTEIELNGVTHRFLGRMWAEVKDDGTLGSTGAVDSQTQRLLSDMVISQSPEQPSTASGDPSDTSNVDFTPSTTVEPEINQIPPSEIFDPSAETPIDAQFANVEVPQSVKDEYAEVLATRNGIRVMQFLDSLPPEQAGSLRVNTPNSNISKTTSTKTTLSNPANISNSPSTTTQMKTISQAVTSIQSADPRFNSPKMTNAIENYLKSNPELAQQVQQAANDNKIPKSNSLINTIAKGTLGRILGPISAILSPTTMGDGTIQPNQNIVNDFTKFLQDNDVDLYNELVQQNIDLDNKPTDASGDPSDTSNVDFTAPTDASGDPSDTSTVDFTAPTDASGDPSDTSNVDFTAPDDTQTGSGRGDGQAELDARRAKIQADAEAAKAEADAKRQELFRQAQQRMRDAETQSRNARTYATPPAINQNVVDKAPITVPSEIETGQDSDTDTQQGQDNNPNTEVDPEKIADLQRDLDNNPNAEPEVDPQTDTEVDPQTDTTTTKKQDIDATPAITTAVAPNVNTKVDTKTDGDKNTRSNFGGKGRDDPNRTANQMKFNPINIRDPLNLKRYG